MELYAFKNVETNRDMARPTDLSPSSGLQYGAPSAICKYATGSRLAIL